MKRNKLIWIISLLPAVLALQVSAWAQGATSAAWPKKPNFSIRLGTYFTDATGQFRVDSETGEGTLIDVQNVLHVPKTATVFRAHADVRVVSWFAVEGEYYRIAHSSSATIDREITVGDEVFPVNETVSSHFFQNYLDLALKFYLFHRQRWDLGAWVGANIHFVNASLEAQPSDRIVDRKTWAPVPSVGVAFSCSLLPRLYLYGKAGYFKYSASASNVAFDSTRFDISVDYYFWKALGVGLTYEYYDSSLSKHNDRFMGLVANRISGLQIYGVIGF